MTTEKTDPNEVGGGRGGGRKKDGSEAESGGEVDEVLYSRQLYVLGQEASRRMGASSVLVCGLGGLGVEIAKNVILMGVKSVTLYDTKKVTLHDMATQFYLREDEVGRGRAEACLGRLQELNPYVKVEVTAGSLAPQLLVGHSAVVLTDSSLEEQLLVSKWCRGSGGPALVVAAAKGLCGQVFCDFGASFEVLEPKTRELASFPVAGVTNEISSCTRCQKYGELKTQTPEMIPIRVMEPLELLDADLIGPLPVTSEGYKYVHHCRLLYQVC